MAAAANRVRIQPGCSSACSTPSALPESDSNGVGSDTCIFAAAHVKRTAKTGANAHRPV